MNDLGQRRRAAGFSQAALAALLEVDRTTVARWESGVTAPHPYVRAKLAAALRISMAELEQLLGGQPRAAGRLGTAELELLRARTEGLRRLDDVMGGNETYPIYARELRLATDLLRDAGPQREVLSGMVAELAHLVGWSAHDAGRRSEALKLHRTALAAASDAGDRPLVSEALALLAYLEADPAAAAAAVDSLDGAATPFVRVDVHARASWAYAAAGDVRRSEAALDAAREAYASADRAGPEPPWINWVDDTSLDVISGACWIALGKPALAIPPLERALSALGDARGRDKSLYLLWLAGAYLGTGEPEQAAHAFERGTALGGQLGSARVAATAKAIELRLKPHR
ncbi:helix-turn-helix transcriptional regulator [Kribbella sandramycini]|uniref:Helix-turn-helix transcriptional regulator n=1 Tax=Kribbella sandramycini TaxID=60450 RepID=A0A7Y4KVY8_9ACTN|nr:transcriptional regulator with XRE-family HTH domain [Kribbella sandramycini]NOL39735.1 helix-turn-helix transcriptional regulator [Kribbella sandramycini]